MTDIAYEINKIPGDDGWWKVHARREFMDAADDMLRAGMTEGQVIDILQRLYAAVAECYGE